MSDHTTKGRDCTGDLAQEATCAHEDQEWVSGVGYRCIRCGLVPSLSKIPVQVHRAMTAMILGWERAVAASSQTGRAGAASEARLRYFEVWDALHRAFGTPLAVREPGAGAVGCGQCRHPVEAHAGERTACLRRDCSCAGFVLPTPPAAPAGTHPVRPHTPGGGTPVRPRGERVADLRADKTCCLDVPGHFDDCPNSPYPRRADRRWYCARCHGYPLNGPFCFACGGRMPASGTATEVPHD